MTVDTCFLPAAPAGQCLFTVVVVVAAADDDDDVVVYAVDVPVDVPVVVVVIC